MKKEPYIDKPCECPGPGFCERFGIEQVEYTWRICSEQCTEKFPCSKETSRGYREKWSRGKVAARRDRLRKIVQASPAEREKMLAKQAKEKRSPCVHLGEPTGETKECKSCNRTVTHEVFTCEIHGLCILSRSVDEIRCCRHCTDYKPRFSLPVVEAKE